MHEVLRAIVNIHEHIVTEELPRSHRVDIKSVSCIFNTHSRIDDITAVITLTILVRWLRTSLQSIKRWGDCSRRKIVFRHYLTIWKAILSSILIVSNEVKVKSVCWTPKETSLTTKLIDKVGMWAIILITEESILSSIEASYRECHLIIQFLIMTCLNLTMQFRTNREFYIRPLILERVTTIESNQSTFGIHTIKRTLRTM